MFRLGCTRMNLSHIEFLVEEAFVNLRRNGLMTLAAIGTVALALAVFGGFGLIVWRLENLANSLPPKFAIDVFLKDNVSRQHALELQQQFQKHPDIAQVTFKPKEQAWPEFQKELQQEITAALPYNPLPDSFVIQVKDPSRTGAVSAWLKSLPEVDAVRDAKEEVDIILSVATVVRWVGIGGTILLLIATGIIIYNAVRLTVFARRREIRIMQLIGATSGTIRTPFVLEGVVQGVIGAWIACGLIFGVSQMVSHFVMRKLAFLDSLGGSPMPFWVVFLVQTLLGALIGGAVSTLSVRKYLQAV